MSDLNKLKELAERCDSMRVSVDQNAAYGNFIACIEPKDVVALFEQLEAAQKRADRTDAMLTEALESLKAAEAEIARRDQAAAEPVAWQFFGDSGKWLSIHDPDEAIKYGYKVRGLFPAAQPSALPDHAAGEPVAYADPMAFSNFSAGTTSKEWMRANQDSGLMPLYAAGQPAALPPEVTPAFMREVGEYEFHVKMDEREAEFSAMSANWMREQAKALGAKPENVVVLPQRYGCEGYHIDEAYLVAQSLDGEALLRDDVIAALDAAGVKWKEAE